MQSKNVKSGLLVSATLLAVTISTALYANQDTTPPTKYIIKYKSSPTTNGQDPSLKSE